MKFNELVDRQLASLNAEGRTESWDESFSRIADAFDSFSYYATVGKADFSFAVSLANLEAEAEKAYVDHQVQANQPYRTLVEAEQKELAKGRKITTIGQAKGRLTFSVDRLRHHLGIGKMALSVGPLLVEIGALASLSAHDLHVSLNENENVEEEKPKTRGKKA